VCKKIKFVGVVVFEKKRFEAIVDGNAYAYERKFFCPKNDFVKIFLED
jgi:hypothetical protein